MDLLQSRLTDEKISEISGRFVNNKISESEKKRKFLVEGKLPEDASNQTCVLCGQKHVTLLKENAANQPAM